ncbi:MAG: c-type cytochrome [Myxococcota bacterium]
MGVLLLAVGCGEEEPERVWQPSDHGRPAEQAVDPSRVPQQGGRSDAPVDPDQVRTRAAAALWRVRCAGCHGPAGGGGGPELPPGAEAPDMTSPEWQESHTDEEVAAVIREGRGAMPAFGDEVNPTGVRALVAHIRGLAGEPAEGEPAEDD